MTNGVTDRTSIDTYLYITKIHTLSDDQVCRKRLIIPEDVKVLEIYRYFFFLISGSWCSDDLCQER